MNHRNLLGALAFGISCFLRKTVKIKVSHHPNYRSNEPYLFAFWHGKQFLPIWQLIRVHHTDGAVLVSPSKDGDILTSWLGLEGYKVIRGSSRRNNIAALAAMTRKLKQGLSLGFGIDGPLGPIHKVKPGMTFMAQKAGVAILPVGVAFNRKWIFEKAWDKLEIPKPFSKASLYFGEPLIVLPDNDLEEYNKILETRIQEAEARALQCLG